MTGTETDAYLRTRIAVMATRLLTPGSTDRLFSEEPGRVISEHMGLPADLALTDEQGRLPDPGFTERVLNHALVADLAVLLRPLSGEARQFLDFWGNRFDLFNLKALIRGKIRGLDDREIRQHLYEVRRPQVMPVDRLLQAENVLELLRQLERGPYGEIARRARLAFEEHQDPLVLDATVDQRFMAGLMKRARKLPTPHGGHVARLAGTVIDHMNLVWLVRYRLAYGLSPSETYFLLIPPGGQLTRDTLLSLVELDNLEAMLGALPAPLTRAIGTAHNAFEIERRLDLRTRALADRLIHNSPSVLARAYAYLWSRSADLSLLQAILQGQRLGLGSEQVRVAAGLALAEAA